MDGRVLRAKLKKEEGKKERRKKEVGTYHPFLGRLYPANRGSVLVSSRDETIAILCETLKPKKGREGNGREEPSQPKKK